MPEKPSSNGQSRGATTRPGAPAVLIIDDDPAILNSLASVFETYRIPVATARNGAEGLAEFRRTSPDLVLTDVIMPERDGIGLIVDMRRERPGIRIVAMSGGGRIGKSDFLTVAKQLGADSIVQKPLDIDKLLEVIRGHLPSLA